MAIQPTSPLSPSAIGTIVNCPKDPPALTMPLAIARFSGGIRRATAARSCDGPLAPAPHAIRIPTANTSAAVDPASGIRALPTATIRMPPAITRPAP